MHNTRIKVKRSSKSAGVKIALQLQQESSHTTCSSTTKIHEFQSSKYLALTKSSKIKVASIKISPYNLQKALIHAKPRGGWKGKSTSNSKPRLHVQMAMATRRRKVLRAIIGSNQKGKETIQDDDIMEVETPGAAWTKGNQGEKSSGKNTKRAKSMSKGIAPIPSSNPPLRGYSQLGVLHALHFNSDLCNGFSFCNR